MDKRKDRLKITLAMVWLVFTVALACWWMIFGLRQIEQLKVAAAVNLPEATVQHRMLIWEGSVLIALLVGAAWC